MSNFKRAPVPGGPLKPDIVGTLHAIQLDNPKPVLPAEIISAIIDYLPVPELLRFARASKRMKEMVYDDTRWVQKLQRMGCWSEAEARKRFEAGMRRKWEAQRSTKDEATSLEAVANEDATAERPNITLFDAGLEEEKRKRAEKQAQTGQRAKVADTPGNTFFSPTGISVTEAWRGPVAEGQDPRLHVLSTIRSIRGAARLEYGRVYAALAPFYNDLARSKSHMDPMIFQKYHDPEQQAQMLAQLKIFARGDLAQGWTEREEKIDGLVAVFEAAVLREFEQGYEAGDVDERMRKYAHVLVALNGGQAGVDLFVRKHPLFVSWAEMGNPMDCINQASMGNIALGTSHEFFTRLAYALNDQFAIIPRVFPSSVNVAGPLLDRVGKTIGAEFVTPLLDEAHERNAESYLKAVAGVFQQSLRFTASLRPPEGLDHDFQEDIDKLMLQVFEPHVDLYLQDELAFFKNKSDTEVANWESKLSQQDASTEAFFMSNVNRQADKRDFLSSFKKVVMMPVNALPVIPVSSPFSTAKAPATSQPSANGPSLDPLYGSASQGSTRPNSPGIVDGSGPISRARSPTLEAPRTELAAKAALMNSRLEGIRSLFSIEVALNLVHAAKTSLERVALLTRLGGTIGEEAKVQCLTIFVLLLNILGSRHIRPGFTTAVDHLSKYNPREVSEHSQPGVAPLVTFLELVNVGDLIQQMVDVFYEQELVATRLTDRTDFLDPALKEKKRFEQMLDERVAAGLNKGIDVLMDEVEYLCATTQAVTDFNPDESSITSSKSQVPDIGPSQTARQIVEVVSSHTKMLVGSTDKNVLDVFNQEVGLRLFAAVCKHIKRQRISVTGAIKLISSYIATLRNSDLLQYFKALRELAQIYLIDPQHAKELASIIADGSRFHGIFGAEEVYEFAARRADWYLVKRDVERAMYGFGCVVM
ncbi:MAG: F-box protein: endocytic membrane traffic, recycling ReCYcling 1 [Thelocarpon superellum]|nr:MAG: F-box protein: endocytic membrane traffic, recycling ReCYcling 1 [Thelocarpon superellum]